MKALTQSLATTGSQFLADALEITLGTNKRSTPQPRQPLLVSGKAIDPLLLIVTVSLLAIGLVMVGSASIDYAAKQTHDPFYFTKRHALYIAMGLCVMVMSLSLPLKFWQKNSQLFLLGGFCLLLLVLVPGIGRRVNGSQRWISLGFFTLQVSEFVKVFLLFYLADYFAGYEKVRNEKNLTTSFKPFIKPMAMVGVVAVLLLLEPDFGTAVVILVASLAIMFVAGIPLLRFLMMMTGAIAFAALAVWLEPYRLKRLTTFVDPWADDVKFQSGYQLTQSLIAFGRGEWFGLGLGNSVQKLFYLPEAHTDFVFSIWAEEFGLMGVLVVIVLFGLLVFRAISISLAAYKQREHFISYLAIGFAMIIGGQAFINMGVASGLLPTKGLTLPFLSYGGSSLLVCCWMVGLLMRAQWEFQALHTKAKASD